MSGRMSGRMSISRSRPMDETETELRDSLRSEGGMKHCPVTAEIMAGLS
jgi:hypothetical protein